MGDINHYKPTRYYKGERFLLDEIYGQIEANEAKLDQLEDQIRWDYYYASNKVYEERNFIIQKLYKQNDELYGVITMRYIIVFMEIHQNTSPHNNIATII
jgi:predicted double-glycine peptidase